MIRQSLNSLPSLKPLHEMAARCEAADGCAVKLYWNLLESRRRDPQAFDYLYFPEQGNTTIPIGLLSIYYFQDGVEVTAMVEPEHRHHGVFTQLMEKVFNVLRLYQVKSYLLDCNAKAYGFNMQCMARGGVLHHTEIEMYGPTSAAELKFSGKKTLTLELAKKSDMEMLIQLHQASFPGASLASVRDRLTMMLSEPMRQTWLGRNQEGKIVGKLHVREDENAVFIHDLGVIPTFQRQGYAISLLYEWYQRYTFPKSKPIVVDVLGDNSAAIQLYTACGFEITNQYNFWQFKLGSNGGLLWR